MLAAFAPALDSAGQTLATVYADAPFNYNDGKPVRNYYKTGYRGVNPIREAIRESMNIIAVKTLITHRGGIVQDHFSLRVGDPAVELGFNIGTHVGNGRVGAIDLKWSGPPGKTADGQGLIDIRVYHTIRITTMYGFQAIPPIIPVLSGEAMTTISA